MLVGDVTISESERGARLGARVRWSRGDADVELVYRDTPAGDLRTPGDALIATLLAPAMAAGEDIEIDAPVSAKLASNVRVIADVWMAWRRSSRRPRVVAAEVSRDDLSPSVVASFFSGGLDSFFTATRARDEPITTLITCTGITSSRHPYFEPLVPRLGRAAAELGMRHLVVDTNVFTVGNRVIGDWFHQVPVLAGVALGLGAVVRRCYIPSGISYRYMVPMGTHPLVDHLWSTETLEFVHDGAEFVRLEKARVVAHSDLALRYLNVCNEIGRSIENCRVCDKCQWTALVLHQEGTLDRCPTLGPVTPRSIRRTVIGPQHRPMFGMLRDETTDPAFRSALASAIARSQLRGVARPAGRLLRRLGLRGGPMR